MDEEWVTIEEFPKYEVSKDGRVRNKETGHIKSPSRGGLGYPVVSLWKDDKQYLRTIHILLGRTFIPNPDNKPQINHIDGNKENYNLENLEWVTPLENMSHARRTGLHKSDGDKAVLQFTKNGSLLHEYKSASEASRATGINRGNISVVARGNGRSKTAGGYIWKYKEDTLHEQH